MRRTANEEGPRRGSARLCAGSWQPGRKVCGFKDTSGACRCPRGEHTQHKCARTRAHIHDACTPTGTCVHAHALVRACMQVCTLTYPCTHTQTPLDGWGPLFIAVCGSHSCQVLRRRMCYPELRPKALQLIPPGVERLLGPSGPNSVGAQSMSDPSTAHSGAFRPTPKGAPSLKAPGSGPAQPPKWR